MSRPWSLLIALAIAGIATNSGAQTNPLTDHGHDHQDRHDHDHDHGHDHDHEHPPGQAVSRYWIGIAGGTVPLALRSHLRIDPSQGVIVYEISANSPAAEGGFEKYDVIVRVNGDPIGNMRQFADIVTDQGKMQGQLAIEVIRHGQNETVYVTPIEKPFQRELAPPPRRNRGRFGGHFGGQAFGFSIDREGDSPTKITVRRGDETWQIDMGDPDSLAQLPAELRPLVEQAAGEGPAVGFLKEMLEGNGGGLPFGLGGTNDAEMQRRLQEMEQQVEELRRRFGVPEEPALTEPPLFQPQEGPAELEIPAET